MLDTNILLRTGKEEDPQHAVIAGAIEVLSSQGAVFCYTSQIPGEFWNAAARPLDRNGLGLSPLQANRLATIIEEEFELLPDSRIVHERWRVLLLRHSVRGVQVHDARIAASMHVHGVNLLLTGNRRDFSRFTGLRAVNPE